MLTFLRHQRAALPLPAGEKDVRPAYCLSNMGMHAHAHLAQVMSNLYLLKNGSLTMNPKRTFNSTPLVKLGDEHFARVCAVKVM